MPLISNSCHQFWTLTDVEATELNVIPQGAFFEMDIDGVTYYCVSEFDQAGSATELKCLIYSDEARTTLVEAGTFTGFAYEIRYLAGWNFDTTVQGTFGRWISNPVTIYQEGGKWTGVWVADVTPLTGVIVFSFDGDFQLQPLSVFGLTATPTLDAGGALAAGTYCYRVSAVDADSYEGAASPAVSVELTGTGDVMLEWLETPGADHYNVYGRECPCPNDLLADAVLVPDWEDTGGVGTPAEPPNEPAPEIAGDCPILVIDNGDGTESTLTDCDDTGCFTGTGPNGDPITVCIEGSEPPDTEGPGMPTEDETDGSVVVVQDPDDNIIVIPVEDDGSAGDGIIVYTPGGQVCRYGKAGPSFDPAEWLFTSSGEVKTFALENAVSAEPVYVTYPDVFTVSGQTDTQVDITFDPSTPGGDALAYNFYYDVQLYVNGILVAMATIDDPSNFADVAKTGRLNLYELFEVTDGDDCRLLIRSIVPGEVRSNPFPFTFTHNWSVGTYSGVDFFYEDESIYPNEYGTIAHPDTDPIGELVITNGYTTITIEFYIEAP